MPKFYMILTQKISKISDFVWYLPEKINKILEFYMIFARKMPEFYIIIARKIFFPNLEASAPLPLSPMPMKLDFSWGGFFGGFSWRVFFRWVHPKKNPLGILILGMYPGVWTLPGMDISLCTCKMLKIPDTGKLPVSGNLLVIYRQFTGKLPLNYHQAKLPVNLEP